MHPPHRRSPQTDALDEDHRHSGVMPDPGDIIVGPGQCQRTPSRRDRALEAPAHGVAITCWSAAAGPGPILLILAAVAGVAYGWRMGSSIEIYYAAAARSMSASWHDFAYGAFDPAGTISVDKLPGALWIQALSVRLFGVHTWAIVLPQVVEGVLTVLVLYRVVRRLAGAEAAIVAAAVLAVSPAAVTLDRGNISDTLLILLLVLAADALVGAMLTGSRWGMLLAGLWVGLAFQAKMVEAWLVIPVLAITYVIAFAGTLRARLLRLGAMVAVIAAVSMSWMIFISLTPASHRPYVDGSQHDSIFEQVFDYNGLGRVGQPSPNTELGHTLGIPVLIRARPQPGVEPAPAGPRRPRRRVAAAGGTGDGAPRLMARWRRPRTDLVRAGVVLWGSCDHLDGRLQHQYHRQLVLLGSAGSTYRRPGRYRRSLAWQRRRSYPTQIAVVSRRPRHTAGRPTGTSRPRAPGCRSGSPPSSWASA